MLMRLATEFREHYGVTARDVILCLCGGIIYVIMLLPWISVEVAAASGMFAFAMLCILIADTRRMLVPDVLSLPSIPLGLVASAIALPYPWQSTLH